VRTDVLLKPAAAAVLALAVQTTAPALSVVETARAVQPGELIVLTARSSAAVTDLHVQAFDRAHDPFRIDDHTWRVLVGIDLDVEPGAYPVTIDAETASGPIQTIHELHVTDKTFRTRRLRVAEGYVNPPPETLRRIEDEAARLERLWAESAGVRLWTTPFIRPVPQRANSAFGTRSIFNGQPRSPHGGADFPSPAGAPVKAPGAGRVVLADNLYYTGATVVIDHGLGLVSLFAHLSKINVRTGDSVDAGTMLGLVGATGRVTGPHLHWTVRAAGARVDPLSLLAVLGIR
jgi:murein DD-endopeptidase MepM/ murein hydrolase activator NlpD